MKRSFKRRFWVLLSLVTKVPRRRQHVKKGVTRLLARGRGNGLPRQSADWLAMTGTSGAARNDGGSAPAGAGTDCRASDIGHWRGMATLWQSEARRENGLPHQCEHWFAMTGTLGLARGRDGGDGGYFRLRRKRRMRRTRAARQGTACRAESI